MQLRLARVRLRLGTLRQSYVGAMLRLCGTGRRSSRAGSHRAQVSETTNGLRACLSTAFHLCLSRACLGKSSFHSSKGTQQGGTQNKGAVSFSFLAGNLYDAIIARRLSREILNFGFAGNGHEDIGVAKHITKLAAAVIVLDCLPNMNPATVKAKTVPIVKYLRANGHATTPIVMAEIPPLLSEANWYLLR